MLMVAKLVNPNITIEMLAPAPDTLAALLNPTCSRESGKHSNTAKLDWLPDRMI
jgi:hypothetical protein